MERFFADHGVQLTNTTEMGSNETIKQAVMAGMGLSFISEHTIGLELAAGRLVELPVTGTPVTRQWYVVHRADKQLLPMTLAFLDFVRTEGPRLIVEQAPIVPVRRGCGSAGNPRSGFLPSRGQPWWSIVFLRSGVLPLDRTADRGDLLAAARCRLARPASWPRRGRGARLAGAGFLARIVEPAAVLELQVGVEAEEVRRAYGAVGLGHCLRFVEHVGEGEVQLAAPAAPCGPRSPPDSRSGSLLMMAMLPTPSAFEFAGVADDAVDARP